MKNGKGRGLRLVALMVLFGVLALGGGAAMAGPIDEGVATERAWPQVTVATVSFRDRMELDKLAEGLDILSVDHAAGTFDALLRPEQLAALRGEGRAVQVDVAQSAQLNAPRTPSPGQVSGIPGYACYRTVEETFASLDQLAVAHPDLAAWSDVGDSWDKATPGANPGYDINALVLTNRAVPGPKPKLMIISAIHAREYATAELATRFAELLVANYGIDPEITWLLDTTELHLIPQANPDGRKQAEGGYSWRKNVNNANGCTTTPYYGTDLNRNSSFMWNIGGSSGYACDETYRGPSAASEPEVQAIQNYAAAIFPDQRGPDPGDPAPETATGVFLTLHSYGQLVLYPWGYTTVDAPNGPALATLGRKFGYFNNYTVCQDCLYAVSGSTDDWVYGELGVPSYTFEIGTTFFQSCAFFEQNIVPRNMPALLYALKAARLPYQEPMGPEVTGPALSVNVVSSGTTVILTGVADDSRYDSNGYGNEPVQTISAARYSVDAPPWAEGVVFEPIQAADGNFDGPVENLTATLDTTDWSSGRHTVYLQAQDSLGNWGVPSAVFLTIAAPPHTLSVDALPFLLAAPGVTLNRFLTIHNLGDAADSYTLTVSGRPTWSVTLPASVGPVAAGDLANVPLSVTPPVTVTEHEKYTFTVTVASMNDPIQAITVPVTAIAQVVHAVTATSITNSITSAPGRAVTVTLRMENSGNVTETVELTYSTTTEQADWLVSLPMTLTLGPDMAVVQEVVLSIPPATPEGYYSGQIHIFRTTQPNIEFIVPVYLFVVWQHAFFPVVFGP